ncbi:hypothetical protein D3C85_1362540 [compost metagenome]
MCRPHREQARSYSFFVVNLALAYNPIPPCGSEPARDGGMTGNINVECAGLIASRLAPTVFCGDADIASIPNPLWERACPGRRSDEGGVSGNIDVGYADSHIRILRSAGFVVNLEVLGNLPHDFVEGFSQK